MDIVNTIIVALHLFGLVIGMGSGVALGVLMPAIGKAGEGERDRLFGIGDALMHQVDGIVARAYDLGGLGASDDGRRLYLRHGWEPWSGPLGVLTQSGVQFTPDDEGAVLVLRTPETAEIDTDGRLICEYRRGDVW